MNVDENHSAVFWLILHQRGYCKSFSEDFFKRRNVRIKNSWLQNLTVGGKDEWKVK